VDNKTDWIIRLTAEIERLHNENQILRAENHQLKATLARLHELASQR
jgi:hypothetical protein